MTEKVGKSIITKKIVILIGSSSRRLLKLPSAVTLLKVLYLFPVWMWDWWRNYSYSRLTTEQQWITSRRATRYSKIMRGPMWSSASWCRWWSWTQSTWICKILHSLLSQHAYWERVRYYWNLFNWIQLLIKIDKHEWNSGMQIRGKGYLKLRTPKTIFIISKKRVGGEYIWENLPIKTEVVFIWIAIIKTY